MRCFGRGLLLALVIAAIVSCSKGDESARRSTNQPPPKQVKAARAEMRAMLRSIAANGTLAAQEKSLLSAKVSGRVEFLPVDLGTVFRKGDLLAQIEPRDYELALQQAAAALAQARTALGLDPIGSDDSIDVEQVSAVRQAKAVLDEANANRDRVRQLFESRIAPQSELDTAEAAYKVAFSKWDTAREDTRTRLATAAQRRAEYELARKQLADASVRAPFDGAVQSRVAHVGEYVAPGTAMLEVVKTDPLRLRLQVPERECALVRTGQLVHLFVEGDTNAYSGRVARLSPALDEVSRMLLVEADVPACGSLRAGLFARGTILVNEQDQSLSVPADALIIFAGIEKVVVVQDGKALEKSVTTGRRAANWAEILSGISAGEPVILNPGGIRTGEAIRVMNGETLDQTSSTAGAARN